MIFFHSYKIINVIIFIYWTDARLINRIQANIIILNNTRIIIQIKLIQQGFHLQNYESVLCQQLTKHEWIECSAPDVTY